MSNILFFKLKLNQIEETVCRQAGCGDLILVSAMEREIVSKLKKEILAMQGVPQLVEGRAADTGLGPITGAFPYGFFPVGIHEFVSTSAETAASVSGFMAALLSRITRHDGICLWIGTHRMLFPPALVFFGLNPHNIIFIDNRKPADLSWMIEQALKCEALSAVVGEISDLDLAQSRRLQLAVEQSRVNCFLHRRYPAKASTIASVCRWKILPIASVSEPGLPGVGFPAWEVTLEKVRNGQPGSWRMWWAETHFESLAPSRDPGLSFQPLSETATA